MMSAAEHAPLPGTTADSSGGAEGKEAMASFVKGARLYEEVKTKGGLLSSGPWRELQDNEREMMGEAIKCLRKAAEGKVVGAKATLGIMCYHGHGLPQNYIDAFAYFEGSLEDGDKEAHVSLGTMLRSGDGTGQDVSKAMEHYALASEAGLADGSYMMGLIYFDGEADVVEQDFAQALGWFKVAAQQGDVAAMFDVGKMLYQGPGEERDADKAEYWLKRAARRGNTRAEGLLWTLRRHAGESAVVELAFPKGSTVKLHGLNRPEMNFKLGVVCGLDDQTSGRCLVSIHGAQDGIMYSISPANLKLVTPTSMVVELS